MTTAQERLTWFDWILLVLIAIQLCLALYGLSTYVPGIETLFPALRG